MIMKKQSDKNTISFDSFFEANKDHYFNRAMDQAKEQAIIDYDNISNGYNYIGHCKIHTDLDFYFEKEDMDDFIVKGKTKKEAALKIFQEISNAKVRSGQNTWNGVKQNILEDWDWKKGKDFECYGNHETSIWFEKIIKPSNLKIKHMKPCSFYEAMVVIYGFDSYEISEMNFCLSSDSKEDLKIKLKEKVNNIYLLPGFEDQLFRLDRIKNSLFKSIDSRTLYIHGFAKDDFNGDISIICIKGEK